VRKIGSVVALGAIALLVAAVSAFAGQATGAATAQKVTVGMREFKFAVTPKSVKKNVPVTFALTNNGSTGHDFKIGGKKSPLVAASKKGTLKVTFKKAGRYSYLCTVPGHAAAGMKGVLVVK
jgi:plastocyanin